MRLVLKGLARLILFLNMDMVYANDFMPAFYAGLGAGYGSTTWSGLVPIVSKQNAAILLSTPKKVQEGGLTWALYGGYEFTPYFALEASYMHYPRAAIFFSEDSLFAFDHPNQLSFQSFTNTIHCMAKLMLPILNNLRLYSATGLARIYRQDLLFQGNRISPSFGFGLLSHASDHILVQFGLNYTAGYGESELEPSHSYIPFLYSAIFSLIYRF